MPIEFTFITGATPQKFVVEGLILGKELAVGGIFPTPMEENQT
jgi:hypothetical protein